MTLSDDAGSGDGSVWQEVGGALAGVWVHRRTYAVMRLAAPAGSTPETTPDPALGEPMGRLELMGDPDIFQAVTQAGRRLTDESGERPAAFGSLKAAVGALVDSGGWPSIGAAGPSSNDEPREL
jgi:hypothetical protein